MNPNLPTIASFWCGPYLGWFERMCLLSFVKHGHRQLLYTHGEVKNVPDGVEVRPVKEIFDIDPKIFLPKEKRVDFHPAAPYSDFFRWHLQKKTDYIYSDTDRFCLKPFDLYSLEEIAELGLQVSGSTFTRLRRDSRTLNVVYRLIQQKYPIPPWLPFKQRMRLRWLKSTGRGVMFPQMQWAFAGGRVVQWALQHTGETYNNRPHDVTFAFYINGRARRNHINLLFVDESIFGNYLREANYYIVGLDWPAIYFCYDGKFRKFLDNPPKGSWLEQQAAQLGIDPRDAPMIETRKKNREYMADITGNKNFLL